MPSYQSLLDARCVFSRIFVVLIIWQIFGRATSKLIIFFGVAYRRPRDFWQMINSLENISRRICIIIFFFWVMIWVMSIHGGYLLCISWTKIINAKRNVIIAFANHNNKHILLTLPKGITSSASANITTWFSPALHALIYSAKRI